MAGANPDVVSERVPGLPTTYLAAAAASGRLDLVKLLLRHQAQVNQPASFKTTPLVAAAGKANKALAALLLRSKTTTARSK